MLTSTRRWALIEPSMRMARSGRRPMSSSRGPLGMMSTVLGSTARALAG